MDYPIRLTEQLRPQLRALRQKRGVTQTELGHWLGVGQARIAEIERSPGTVSFDQMLKLLSLLGAGLVLRDASFVNMTEDSNRKPPTPAKRTPKQGLRATTAKKLNEPPKPKPNADVEKASARNYVILPKKGSW